MFNPFIQTGPDNPSTETAQQSGDQIHAATAKTTPVDADEFPLADSAASWILKKVTWANIKATLKAYFDTLYAAVGSGITNSAGANVIMKSDGTNAVASRISDDGTNIVANSGAGEFSAGDTNGDFNGNFIRLKDSTNEFLVNALLTVPFNSLLDGITPSSAGNATVGSNAKPYSAVYIGLADNVAALIRGNNLTANRTFDWPDLSGTVAMQPIITPSTPTTGQTVSSSTGKIDETLYITPAGTLLALTVELPASANARVGQIIRGFISQIITTLTVNVSGGGTIVGDTPVTSAVNSTFAYQCVSLSGAGTWIRIQ